MNTYTKPIPKPFQLMRDLFRTHWNTNALELPEIIEIPSPEFERADLINEGPFIFITVLEVQKEPIHIEFKNIDITVPVTIDISLTDKQWNRTSNRRGQNLLYDYMYEIERILQENQHNPNTYLIDGGFDLHEDTSFLRDSWNNTINVELIEEGYAGKAAYVTGNINFSLPSDRESSSNKKPLIVKLGERLDEIYVYMKKQGDSVFNGFEINQDGKKYQTAQDDIVDLTDDWELYRFDITTNIEDTTDNDSFVIKIKSPSSSITPQGITWDNTYYRVVDANGNKVYSYDSSGVHQSAQDFDLTSENTNPTGITWDGTYYRVIDGTANKIYTYNSSGSYVGGEIPELDLDLVGDNTNASGITLDSGRTQDLNYFRILDEVDRKLYRYDLTSKSYNPSVDINLLSDNNNSRGIVWDGTYYRIVDRTDNKVYTYDSSGVHQSAQDFDLFIDLPNSVGNTNPNGVTWDGTYYRIIDSGEDKVYTYNSMGDYEPSQDFSLNAGFFIDHIQLSTNEYQFFLWSGWNIDADADYGINTGTVNGAFRSVGDGISLLGGYGRFN